MDEEYKKGYDEAMRTIRYILKLKKMGISDCEIVNKFKNIDGEFIHELMAWMK